MKQLRIVAAVVFALALTPLWQASAADAVADLSPGGSYTWDGATAPAVNVNYHDNLGTGEPDVDGPVREVSPVGVCSSDPTTYCEHVLLSFTNAVPDADADGKLTRMAQVKITEALGDVDLLVYDSDAEGTKGARVGMSAGPLDTLDHTDLDETVRFPVVTTRPTVEKPTQPDVSTKWYLVEVVYYAAAGYTGTATF